MEAIPKQWWARNLVDLSRELGGSKQGLTGEEADVRLGHFGKNVLTERKRLSILGRFLSKLTNPLILLLLFAAFVSGILGQIPDLVIIIGIILVSITIDVLEEHTAVEGAEKLRKRVSLTASVVRNGKQQEIPMSHVVPGDTVFLSVGDIVPADGRVIQEKDFLVDQSALTGESYPQRKDAAASVLADAQVADRKNAVFMGTNVIAGEAYVLVVSTGLQTELGKIAKELVEKRPPTEFQKGINNYGVLLTKIAIVVSVLVFFSHLFFAHDMFTTLLFVLAVAIGFAPELLPVIITINLSKGAIRMSKKGVIVKSLPAIENFGSMDTLCTDKTGTLTENKITIRGYESMDGKKDMKVLDFGYLNSLFQVGFRGPMEQAILAHVKKADVSGYSRVGSLPFDFFRKRVSVILSHGKENILITKGAPEEIFSVCSLTPDAKKKADNRFKQVSRDGLRTLAVAYKPIAKKVYEVSDEKDLIFLGFLTFFDPPKKTAAEALKNLEHQGIAIKILTGDNELVTQKVCSELGLPIAGSVTSRDIEGLSDADVSKIVEKTTIFARLNPDLKVRIINSLKANGHVVGFLGDGINDATSLKTSDIGISVENATDVAKETADIILLHKDLHVLSQGVSSGRQTFWNVMKYIMMGTSSNVGNMISLTIGSLVLPFLPMLPTQILLNDMLYDISQLFLATDRVDESILKKPHKWDIGFLRQFLIFFGPVNSLFDLATFYLLLRFFHASVATFRTGWFVENIVLQTLIVFSIRTVMPIWKSRPSLLFALGLTGIVIIALALPFTPVGPVFSLVRLPISFYGVLVGLIAGYALIVEVVKRWFYTHYQV